MKSTARKSHLRLFNNDILQTARNTMNGITTEAGFWFEQDIRTDKARRDQPEKYNDATTGRQRKLLCSTCFSVITVESERLSVAGAHTHYRLNPGGFSYVIACFRDAPGCQASSLPTDEYTWFGGYRWQVACCRQCGGHLGWLFTGADRFYGLIHDRLIAGLA